jgi:hypothetical protein
MTKKGLNKFYVAAEHISVNVAQGFNDNWTRPTLDSAIEHAKEILAKNPSREGVVIVQMIRIVRRRTQPVIVEKL